MEYSDILQGIEKQKESELLSAKLFRYQGLLQAIDFFSQKLNLDQIVDAAFDFTNELLTIEKSVMFIMNDGKYVLSKLKGLSEKLKFINNSVDLQNMALFHGTLLSGHEHLLKYFNEELLQDYEVTMAIPLIIESSIYGFIFISNKTIGDLNGDDYIISEALMKLFNNALENFKRYEQLQEANKELDEKIFNLFAINQSTKVLLGELNLDMLYSLSTDVFAELTQSSSTSFVLYDEKSEKYIIKAFKDVYFRNIPSIIALTLKKSAKINPNNVIINLSKEEGISCFNSIFEEGLEAILPLNPLYIVVLVKNKRILGFVTLGQTVTGIQYKTSIFELVESLASSTYLAISNALLFKQVSDQKKVIQSKLDKIISLNNLIKNINTSSDVSTLLDLTLKTLEVSFDVEKAILSQYDRNSDTFKISKTLNITTRKKVIKPNPSWKRVMEGDSIFEANAESVLQYMDKQLLNDVGECQGILIIPIYMDKIEIEILGAVIIFKYGKTQIGDEENLLTMETIAGHISPILSSLMIMEEQSKFLLPNYEEYFKKALKTEIDEALEFEQNLTVLQLILMNKKLFRDTKHINRLKKDFGKVFPFSGDNIFIIWDGSIKELNKKLAKLTEMKNLIVNHWSLGKEFSSYEEFVNLF
ncbi:MAG: GAF domain-containing protein [Bacillota bacterium]|nr:GAF domain-containing protein [Bacillota bacterium]